LSIFATALRISTNRIFSCPANYDPSIMSTVSKWPDIRPLHLSIFELHTEEESVLTLFHLFKLSGFKVSACLSEKIWNLIKADISLANEDNILVFNSSDSVPSIYVKLKTFLVSEKTDLLVVPRFSAQSFKETRLMINLLKKFPVCVGVYNYSKWFSKIPPLMFNGWKILKRSAIVEWAYSQMIIRHIPLFFISDPHRNSNNPMKNLLRNKTQKEVLDLPFKVSRSIYSPPFDFTEPVFCIPGVIEKHRRDYRSIISFFSRKSLQEKKWKLILLGRPKGAYGKKILHQADSINKKVGEERIVFRNRYVEKDEFDHLISCSTHILAPLVEKTYRYGKDSGAIYDVFKYNKIGIFPNNYFYDEGVIENKAVITYTTMKELGCVLEKIIDRTFDYARVMEGCAKVADYFHQDKYVEHIKTQINNYFVSLAAL